MPLIGLRLMKVVSCLPIPTRKPTCILAKLHTKTVSFITLKAGSRKSLTEKFDTCFLLKPKVTICVQVGKDIAFHAGVFKGAIRAPLKTAAWPEASKVRA